MLHVLSTLVLLLIAAGVRFRKNARLHLRLMAAAFLIDISLVVYIEYSRHAVHQATHSPGPLLGFHILVSLSVVILYLVQMQLGRRVLAGFHASRGLHMKLGMTFCCLRLINYGTSFMVGGSAHQAAPSQLTMASVTTPDPANSLLALEKPIFNAADKAAFAEKISTMSLQTTTKATK